MRVCVEVLKMCSIYSSGINRKKPTEDKRIKTGINGIITLYFLFAKCRWWGGGLNSFECSYVASYKILKEGKLAFQMYVIHTINVPLNSFAKSIQTEIPHEV